MENQPPAATSTENQPEKAPTPVKESSVTNVAGEAEPPHTKENPNEAAGAVDGQPGALAGQPGAVAGQPGAVAGQPGAVAGQPGAITAQSHQPEPVTAQKSATLAKSTSTIRPDKQNNVSPTSSGEDLSEEEIHNIIKQTQDILQFCQIKVDEQKIIGHSLAFMLLRIKESMDSYCKDYIPNLSTFLVNADIITGEYYAKMCCNLPKIGDYVNAIEAAEGDKLESGGDQPVSKGRLLRLVRNATDNYYASAMFVKSVRAVLRDVNNTLITDRRDVMCKIYTPFPDWMAIQDNVNCQLECIRDHTFKILTYIDFLKQGESKAGPKLDFTDLEKRNQKKNDDANKRKNDDDSSKRKKDDDANKKKKDDDANKKKKDEADKAKKNDESNKTKEKGETHQESGVECSYGFADDGGGIELEDKDNDGFPDGATLKFPDVPFINIPDKHINF